MFSFLQRSQTPNRKAARASASTPETARGFLPYRGNSGKQSVRNASPLSRGMPAGVYSRTRYADRLLPASRVLKMRQKASPTKGTASDRLILKRKAMATLTALGRTEKRSGHTSIFKRGMSDGDLMKRKVKEKHESDFDFDTSGNKLGYDVEDSVEKVDACNGLTGDGNSDVCQCCRIATNDIIPNECSCCCYVDDSYECSLSCDSFETKLVSPLSENVLEISSNLSSFKHGQTEHEQVIEAVKDIEMCSCSQEDLNSKCNSKYEDENILNSCVTDSDTDENYIKDERAKQIKLDSVSDAAECDGTEINTVCKQEVIKCDSKLTGIETDTTFVSSLFKPLSSDVDEPIEIYDPTDVSLDASIDIDDLLNSTEMSEIDTSLCTPQDTIPELPSNCEPNNEMGFLNTEATPDMNINQVIKDIQNKDDVLSESVKSVKKAVNDTDINNNFTFKPAFNSPPRTVFGSIVELASGIIPKIGNSKSDPDLLTKDHTYSKTKKPVYFSMKSKSLVCKKVKPTSFSWFVTCSIIQTPSKPLCSAPNKRMDVGSQQKGEAVASKPISQESDKHQQDSDGADCFVACSNKTMDDNTEQVSFLQSVFDTSCISKAAFKSANNINVKEKDTNSQKQSVQAACSKKFGRQSKKYLTETNGLATTVPVSVQADCMQPSSSDVFPATHSSLKTTTCKLVQSVQDKKVNIDWEKETSEMVNSQQIRQNINENEACGLALSVSVSRKNDVYESEDDSKIEEVTKLNEDAINRKDRQVILHC